MRKIMQLKCHANFVIHHSSLPLKSRGCEKIELMICTCLSLASCFHRQCGK